MSWLLSIILALYNLNISQAQGIEKNWIKHDFKTVVEAGVIECFYQTVEDDSVFHVSFQVIRGDDITFYMNDQNKVEVQRSDRQQAGSFQIPKTTGKGDYEICFDNSYSHMNSKLVSIYILSFHSDALMKKFEHDKELNETAHLAKKASDKISINLIEAFTNQAMSRFKQTRDEYILEANNSLVMYWSFFQMLLVCFCGMFQVYFIKRLFNTSSNSKTSNRSSSR